MRIKSVVWVLAGFMACGLWWGSVDSSFAAPQTAQNPAQGPSGVEFSKRDLTVRTQTGEKVRFHVELAQTTAQLTRGLMFRKTLGEREGMLFDFKYPKHISMWMKNTYIPLDMLFADENGDIVSVVENTVPLSKALINSGHKARYVLEVPAGTVDALNLEKGAQLLLSADESQ